MICQKRSIGHERIRQARVVQIEGEGMMRSHSSTRLSIESMLDGGELAIDSQAFPPDSLRSFGQPLSPQLRLRLSVHAFDGAADVGCS